MSGKGKGYPTQPSYPVQQQAYPAPQTYHPVQQGDHPPPYMPAQGAPQGAPPPYTPTPVQPGMYQAPPMQYGHVQYSMQQQQQGYPMMQQQGYVVHGPPMGATGQPQSIDCGAVFDSGARFDGIAQPRIPPPPPGCPPNAAQYASMQGHTVVASRQKRDWFSGGSGGGYNWDF